METGKLNNLLVYVLLGCQSLQLGGAPAMLTSPSLQMAGEKPGGICQ